MCVILFEYSAKKILKLLIIISHKKRNKNFLLKSDEGEKNINEISDGKRIPRNKL